MISIRAPLAGSDANDIACLACRYHFNPRSPCGERPSRCRRCYRGRYFNPRSPCGERRPNCCASLVLRSNFNPRSPCGERQAFTASICCTSNFNPRSPCGERRACPAPWCRRYRYFNPRSPCGERLRPDAVDVTAVDISIRAPLAGSDCYFTPKSRIIFKFQSALPLRGATHI